MPESCDTTKEKCKWLSNHEYQCNHPKIKKMPPANKHCEYRELEPKLKVEATK